MGRRLHCKCLYSSQKLIAWISLLQRVEIFLDGSILYSIEKRHMSERVSSTVVSEKYQII